VLLADRACVDFLFLHGLAGRGVFFVLREKENMDFEVLEERRHPDRRILKDQTIRLRGRLTAGKYPGPLRRVAAVVEVDGQEREMAFLKHVSKWGLSFSRLAGVVRSAVWMKIDLLDALRKYGTAGGPKRPVIVGKQLYFQGFEPFASRPVG
jgi:hypothetical protein